MIRFTWKILNYILSHPRDGHREFKSSNVMVFLHCFTVAVRCVMCVCVYICMYVLKFLNIYYLFFFLEWRSSCYCSGTAEALSCFLFMKWGLDAIVVWVGLSICLAFIAFISYNSWLGLSLFEISCLDPDKS